MKKVRALQILVYVVFGLLLIQNEGGALYKGFVEAKDFKQGAKLENNKS